MKCYDKEGNFLKGYETTGKKLKPFWYDKDGDKKRKELDLKI